MFYSELTIVLVLWPVAAH